MDNLITLIIFSSFVALVFVILLYVLIMPRKRDGTFSNRFAQWLHDFFRFKKLYLESVLRFIYAFATFFIIAFGIFYIVYGIVDGASNLSRYLLLGLGMSVFGPIALRLFYEVLLMGVLLVQNVIDINKKLGKNSGKQEAIDPEDDADEEDEDTESVFVPPVPTPSVPQSAPVYSNPAPSGPASGYPAPGYPASGSPAPGYPAPAPVRQPPVYTPPVRQAPVYNPAVPRPTAPARPAPAPIHTQAPIHTPAPAPAQTPTPAPAPAPSQDSGPLPFRGEEY